MDRGGQKNRFLQSLQTTNRRTQKMYEDILGRTAKTEIWDLDGADSAAYATNQNTYNGRDQVLDVSQFVGSTSGTHQDTQMAYDGNGQLSSLHKPEYDTATYTTTTYNPDDTVATVTDPRGAATTFNYGHVDDSASSESRALVTKTTYSAPTDPAWATTWSKMIP